MSFLLFLCLPSERGARVNAISPGIIITPLARDELNGANGAGYRRMIELSPAGRAGTPDEVATLAELLLTDRGAFIAGSDFLIDGGGDFCRFRVGLPRLDSKRAYFALHYERALQQARSHWSAGA